MLGARHCRYRLPWQGSRGRRRRRRAKTGPRRLPAQFGHLRVIGSERFISARTLTKASAASRNLAVLRLSAARWPCRPRSARRRAARAACRRRSNLLDLARKSGVTSAMASSSRSRSGSCSLARAMQRTAAAGRSRHRATAFPRKVIDLLLHQGEHRADFEAVGAEIFRQRVGERRMPRRLPSEAVSPGAAEKANRMFSALPMRPRPGLTLSVTSLASDVAPRPSPLAACERVAAARGVARHRWPRIHGQGQAGPWPRRPGRKHAVRLLGGAWRDRVRRRRRRIRRLPRRWPNISARTGSKSARC